MSTQNFYGLTKCVKENTTCSLGRCLLINDKGRLRAERYKNVEQSSYYKGFTRCL